jgi:hypothetical protein
MMGASREILFETLKAADIRFLENGLIFRRRPGACENTFLPARLLGALGTKS